MATGEDFDAALLKRIAPATIQGKRGDDKGLTYVLSDGRQIKFKRQRVKDTTAEQLPALIDELVG